MGEIDKRWGEKELPCESKLASCSLLIFYIMFYLALISCRVDIIQDVLYHELSTTWPLFTIIYIHLLQHRHGYKLPSFTSVWHALRWPSHQSGTRRWVMAGHAVVLL